MYQLSSHFLEIRLRVFYLIFSLILTIITSYFYQYEILYIIGRPFLDLDHKFILIDLTEAFYTILKICGIISFLFIIPFFVYHFWSFYIPSRYNFERKSIKNFAMVFFFLLIVELFVLYFIIFPKICEFLLSFEIISSSSLTPDDLQDKNQSIIHEVYTEFEQEIPNLVIQKNYNSIDFSKKAAVIIELTARLESYVKLSTRFYFVILTIFQLPFLVVMLYYYKIIDCYILCKIRKFFIFSSLLISAFVSPPDIISQSILAIFIFFLYEFLVYIGIFFEIKLKNSEFFLRSTT